MKKIFAAAFCAFSLDILFAADFFHPISFCSKILNGKFEWERADWECDHANDDTTEFNVLPRKMATRKNNDVPRIRFLCKKKYSSLKVFKIAYETEKKSGMIAENLEFVLPDKVVDMDFKENGWISNGKYYWLDGWFARPVSGGDEAWWPSLDFDKIFPDAKIGDEYAFSLLIKYQFDDDEIKDARIDYLLTVEENWYCASETEYWFKKIMTTLCLVPPVALAVAVCKFIASKKRS